MQWGEHPVCGKARCFHAFWFLTLVGSLNPAKMVASSKKVNVSQIAHALGWSWGKAKRWIDANDTRVFRRERKPSQAVVDRRRRVAALAQQRDVTNGVRSPKFASASAIRTALQQRGITVSKRTVVRDLRAEGFRSRVRRKVPTMDPAVHKKRLTFARSWTGK